MQALVDKTAHNGCICPPAGEWCDGLLVTVTAGHSKLPNFQSKVVLLAAKRLLNLSTVHTERSGATQSS